MAHGKPAGPPRVRVGETRVGRTLWLALPTGVLVFVGASTPWIAQRVPRFLFPAVAAAGAALVVFSLVNSLIRFVLSWGQVSQSNMSCGRRYATYRPYL